MVDKKKWVEGRVVYKRRWTERLYSLQVDAVVAPFKAGQFAKLALEVDGELVARPYSFVNAPQETPLEFYFITVPNGPLTQRLTRLKGGDVIHITPRAAGFLSLSELPEAESLWLLSTGTAIGPFLSILKTDEPWQRFANVILVHAVRTTEELSYQDQIRRIQELHPEKFKFAAFVSREDTEFAIKARVPDALRDGRLEAKVGVALRSDNAQVMLCGNPDMVRDTTAALEERGLKKNRRKDPGHITVETYW